jgi:hypothetical protein
MYKGVFHCTATSHVSMNFFKDPSGNRVARRGRSEVFKNGPFSLIYNRRLPSRQKKPQAETDRVHAQIRILQTEAESNTSIRKNGVVTF